MPGDHEDIPFVQASGYTPERSDGPPIWLVIHDMEYPERPDAAEWTANYFATGAGGRSVSSHYCLVPETRILYGDLTWRPLSEVQIGDRIVGFDEFPASRGHTRKLRPAIVTHASRRHADCLAIELEDGRRIVCSADHRWLARITRSTTGWRTSQRWVSAEALSVGDKIKAPLRPWSTEDTYRAGYVAGILDGEGTFVRGTNRLAFAQKNGVVLDRMKQLLAEAGIPFMITDATRRTGVMVIAISGLDANLRLTGSMRPARLLDERLWINKEMKSRLHRTDLSISSIERVGLREVVSIETSTATFFAEGVASHNCADNTSIIQCVRLRDVAWTVGNRPGNYRGINWELAGYASQTREQWLDDYGRAMLARVAAVAVRDMATYKIPPRLLTDDEVRRFVPGVTSHWQLGRVFDGTDHTDPGRNFPWDHLIGLLGGDMTAAEVWSYDPNDPQAPGAVRNQPFRPDYDSNRTVPPRWALEQAWANSFQAASEVANLAERLARVEAKLDQLIAQGPSGGVTLARMEALLNRTGLAVRPDDAGSGRE